MNPSIEQQIIETLRVLPEEKQLEALEIKTIDMQQGNKVSRIVAWTFLTEPEQKEWIKVW